MAGVLVSRWCFVRYVYGRIFMPAMHEVFTTERNTMIVQEVPTPGMQYEKEKE